MHAPVRAARHPSNSCLARLGAAPISLIMHVSEPSNDRAVFAVIASLVALIEVALLLFGIAALGIWLWFAEATVLPPGV